MGKLVRCIDSGSGDPSLVQVPEYGVVYRVVDTIVNKCYCLHKGGRSNIWYVLDKTGGFLQSSLLFEELPDNMLEAFMGVATEVEVDVPVN